MEISSFAAGFGQQNCGIQNEIAENGGVYTTGYRQPTSHRISQGATSATTPDVIAGL
jgi:hypothetical protein